MTAAAASCGVGNPFCGAAGGAASEVTTSAKMTVAAMRTGKVSVLDLVFFLSIMDSRGRSTASSPATAPATGAPSSTARPSKAGGPTRRAAARTATTCRDQPNAPLDLEAAPEVWRLPTRSRHHRYGRRDHLTHHRAPHRRPGRCRRRRHYRRPDRYLRPNLHHRPDGSN